MYVGATRKRKGNESRQATTTETGTTKGRPAPLPSVGNQTYPRQASLVGLPTATGN